MLKPTPPSQGRKLHEDSELSLRELLQRMRSISEHWIGILSCVLVALSIAFVVNRYSLNEYKIVSIVAVEETENPLASSIDGMLNLDWDLGAMA